MGHKSIEQQGILPEDDPDSYDDEVEPEETDEDPQSLIFQNKFTFVAPPDQSKLTLHRGDSGGGSHHGDGLLFKQHISRASTGARGGGSSRICPESNELINFEQCGSCEKYRCWPDGTGEEPRECWYDWQARSQHDSLDGEEY